MGHKLREMTLYKYFTIKDKLPSLTGPLSGAIPSCSIASVNAEVRKIINDIQRKNSDDLVGSTSVKRGSYAKYSTDVKLKIADRYLFDFHEIKSTNYYKNNEPQKF